MKATEWRQSAILKGNDDNSSCRAIALVKVLRRARCCAPAVAGKKYHYLVAITMTVLPIVVMTILMMAALAILMIAVVAMISSLCVLVNDKAYLR